MFLSESTELNIDKYKKQAKHLCSPKRGMKPYKPAKRYKHPSLILMRCVHRIPGQGSTVPFPVPAPGYGPVDGGLVWQKTDTYINMTTRNLYKYAKCEKCNSKQDYLQVLYI